MFFQAHAAMRPWYMSTAAYGPQSHLRPTMVMFLLSSIFLFPSTHGIFLLIVVWLLADATKKDGRGRRKERILRSSRYAPPSGHGTLHYCSSTSLAAPSNNGRKMGRGRRNDGEMEKKTTDEHGPAPT